MLINYRTNYQNMSIEILHRTLYVN